MIFNLVETCNRICLRISVKRTDRDKITLILGCHILSSILSSMFTASGSYRFITLSDGETLPRVRVLPSHLSDKFSVLTSSCLWRFCPAKSIAPLVGHFTALRLARRLLYYRNSGYFKITDRTL